MPFVALFLYLDVAVLCLVASLWRPRGAYSSATLGSRLALFATSMIVAGLGAARYWHLWEQVADWGRQVAMQQHWYEERRSYQFTLIIALIGFAGLVVLAILSPKSRGLRRQAALLLPLFLLMIYTAINACSLHQVDEVLNSYLATVRVGALLEFSLVIVVGAAAAHRLLAE